MIAFKMDQQVQWCQYQQHQQDVVVFLVVTAGQENLSKIFPKIDEGVLVMMKRKLLLAAPMQLMQTLNTKIILDLNIPPLWSLMT